MGRGLELATALMANSSAPAGSKCSNKLHEQALLASSSTWQYAFSSIITRKFDYRFVMALLNDYHPL